MRKVLAFVVLVTLGYAGTVLAGSANTNLDVTANVQGNCTITTAAVAFGAYDPITTNATNPLDGTGSVTIACTKGTLASITLGDGANGSRNMTNATSLLAYELYQDNGRSQRWGLTGAEVLTPPAASSKDPRTFTVFGRVPGGQDVTSGNYADLVVATVNF